MNDAKQQINDEMLTWVVLAIGIGGAVWLSQLAVRCWS
jgi:hypothetical protein